MLLAASSVTAPFLGGQTIQHTGELGSLGALALISLAVSVLACVYVLLPKSGFVFSLNAVTVYESLFPWLTMTKRCDAALCTAGELLARKPR
jgi:hypothetical protein